MSNNKYITSVSFKIGKRIYKIDKGDTKDESNDNSLCNTTPTV
jgi:hypothetical protein